MEASASQPDPVASVNAAAVMVEAESLEKTQQEREKPSREHAAATGQDEPATDQDTRTIEHVSSDDRDIPSKTSTKSRDTALPSRRSARVRASYRDFHATFGALGLPMAVAFLLSSLTMLWLAVVQVIPTQVANWLMNTSDLDDGEFWLLSVPSTALVAVATAMLVVFGLCYLALALSMNALFDLPKLAFQTATITAYLSEGFPLPLIQLYLTMLLVSWMLSFYRFQHQRGDPEYVVARVFLLFDLFFSVFAPLIVLGYAYHQFNMDREAFAIREETLSPGSYDRIARLFADPVEVDLFRFGFGHLQFTQTWYLTTKACLNLLGVYKCKKVIVLLLVHRAERASAAKKQPKAREQEEMASNLISGLPKSRSLRSILNRALLVHGKRRHLAFGIVAFLVSIVGILTYVIVSITTSTHNCRDMPECRVISYRWNAGAANDACPCIVYINRNEAPRSFQVWVNASDVTQSLAAAATSGHLKTVQIVNRAVPELPDALRYCHDMEQLILVYSQTQSLPDWVGGFRGLHYIHVESDILHYPLHALPTNLFSHMHGLRFIRFGGATQLHEFPSLMGLHQLTTLVLSMPHALTQLPSLDDLDALVTLVIGDATHVTRLPSLQRLQSLRSFSLFRRNAMCCNGFFTGACDLTDFQCLPRADEPTITCEPARLPPDDRTKLQRIDAFVCSANLTSDVVESEPTALSSDGACGGAVFQQCQLGGRGGICFNGRMQIVHCDVFGEYETMRRRQIVRNVGGACDPRVEAWLGCR